MLNKSHLVEGLRQLASQDLQQSLWVLGEKDHMSSFTEAVSYVFDDARLGEAMDSGFLQNNLSSGFCARIYELDRLIDRVPLNLAPKETIEHPQMDEIRKLASELLAITDVEVAD